MRYVAFLLLLLASLVARAGVYKWIDENGNVHYTDSPTATQPSVEMHVDDSATEPVYGEDGQMSREEKRERLLQSMAEDRLEKQEQREKQRAIKRENRNKCNRYRDQMRHYERASSLYRLDKNGERVYMSDGDRTKATRRLQAKIKQYCR
ncbi:MAG: DUF4124 domain-containing protein [Gammaproteobacteria bacterium]